MKHNRLFSLLVLAMLFASSCSLISGDEEASEDVTAEAGDSQIATTVPVATTAAPATTEAAAADGAGTLDDPRSILNARFAYSEDYYDTDWEGELYGLIELSLAGLGAKVQRLCRLIQLGAVYQLSAVCIFLTMLHSVYYPPIMWCLAEWFLPLLQESV